MANGIDPKDPLSTAREVFTRDELTRRGMSRRDLDNAVAGDALSRIGRDAYVIGARAEDRKDDLLERSLAAAHRTSEGTVLSHASAAVLHGLPTWGIPLDKVTRTRSRPGHGSQRSASVLTFNGPLEDAVTEVHGVRVTTPARTATDIALAYRLDPAICVADVAVQRGRATIAEIVGHVDLAAGRRGVARARAMAELVDGRPVNPLETRSRLAFVRGSLADPEINVELYDADGELLARPDFLWREWRVIGESDGLGKYALRGLDEASVKEELRKEKARERWLADAGYVIIRWTWDDLARPALLVARIRAALLRQEALGLGPAEGRLAG